MLDIKRIKDDPEAVKAGLRAKEVDCDAAVDRILELDAQRRALILSTETDKGRARTASRRKFRSARRRARMLRRSSRVWPS